MSRIRQRDRFGKAKSDDSIRDSDSMIYVIHAKNRLEGNLKAHDILLDLVDNETLLALSGGTSPDYRRMIVDQGDIFPGAVCLVDERYGPVYHKSSNELLIKNSGLFDFLNKNQIDYFRVLDDEDFRQTAEDYDELMDELFNRFEKRIGVMGVGTNLHTAGIFPHSEALASDQFVVAEEVDDEFPKRITLTLKALEEFQAFIILAFGDSKKGAVERVLDEKESELAKYPATFYRKSKVQTYLISDQT